jgi:hypothetical protein
VLPSRVRWCYLWCVSRGLCLRCLSGHEGASFQVGECNRERVPHTLAASPHTAITSRESTSQPGHSERSPSVSGHRTMLDMFGADAASTRAVRLAGKDIASATVVLPRGEANYLIGRPHR